ncbi:MAG: integrin alpha [Pseudomonadota bacterium]|nr:integrin alpha [Pseudomonadota bacterium]
MSINQRYVYSLILSSCLLLTGAKCTLFGSSDGNSSGGDKDTRVEVSDEQKISADSGNFNGNLDSGDQFGSAITGLGDLESDGVEDLAVGAPFDNDGGDEQGSVWILFMDDNGRVDLERKISSKKGDFGGNLSDNDLFGSALAGVGDLNGDGAFDLAVGAPGEDSGNKDRGAVWMLFLNAEGGVREEQKIADGTGGFDGNLKDDDRFGSAIADIGDVNSDGITDLAVGTPNNDDGSDNAGAVWILIGLEI